MAAHPTAIFYGESHVHPSTTVDAFAIVGYSGDEREIRPHHRAMTVIDEDIIVGPFAIIYRGAHLKRGVRVDPYSRVGRNTEVGANSQILYGSRVHDDVVIGSGCTIAGNVSNRVRLGDRVMHHGRLAHRYNSPHGGWHEVDEPSMTIESDVIIGANAILVGDIHIGSHTYIAAGEIVRKDVPPRSVVYESEVIPADEWRGSLGRSGFWSPTK